MLRPANGQTLTHMDVLEWQRERDAKKEDFPFISLSKSQEKLLRQCESDWIVITDKNRFDSIHLRDLDFIYINSHDSSVTEKTKFCEIRDRGKNYLAYLDSEHKKERRQFLHNWKVAIFSAFAGALLARPLWSGIDQIISAIKPFIEGLATK